MHAARHGCLCTSSDAFQDFPIVASKIIETHLNLKYLTNHRILRVSQVARNARGLRNTTAVTMTRMSLYYIRLSYVGVQHDSFIRPEVVLLIGTLLDIVALRPENKKNVPCFGVRGRATAFASRSRIAFKMFKTSMESAPFRCSSGCHFFASLRKRSRDQDKFRRF